MVKKSCQNPFLAILRLKKIQQKKVPMAIKLEGGGKALMAWPLVEDFSFAASLIPIEIVYQIKSPL